MKDNLRIRDLVWDRRVIGGGFPKMRSKFDSLGFLIMVLEMCISTVYKDSEERHFSIFLVSFEAQRLKLHEYISTYS